MGMLPRRDLLRLMGVTPLAVPLLSACGASESPGGGKTSLQLVKSDVARSAGDPGAASAAAASIAALAGSLYGELGAKPGNVVYSPYSISVALAMTMNGAVGKTAAEMSRVLVVEDLEAFNGGLNALTQQLESLAGKLNRYEGDKAEILLDTANSLWGQAGVSWERPFLDTLARDFGTGMRTVDYAQAAEDARRLINEWTAEQTHDKIPEILPPGILDALTRLVLVNAIYLKAPWQAPFEKGLTEDGPFHLRGGSVVDVPMMAGAEASFAWKQGDDWEAIQIPYAGSELAMTVVLPDDITSVGGDLSALIDWTPTESVGLRLPKWKFRLQSRLNKALDRLGMPTAFTDAADFSGMAPEGSEWFISAVLHEAFIAVDEEGTEAAAATAVVISDSAAHIEPRVVRVDRPFVFVIHDLEHNTPLFVGRVDDPSQES
ncbi:MAG TPA: serpin family protein [Nocardioidaceae bacterium]|nr:serpin family protein [Nocardioidaceae bacterium]